MPQSPVDTPPSTKAVVHPRSTPYYGALPAASGPRKCDRPNTPQTACAGASHGPRRTPRHRLTGGGTHGGRTQYPRDPSARPGLFLTLRPPTPPSSASSTYRGWRASIRNEIKLVMGFYLHLTALKNEETDVSVGTSTVLRRT